MEELLRELILMLKNMAPEIWAILIRQVYVDAFLNTIYTIVCIIVAGILYHIIRLIFKNDTELDEKVLFASLPALGIGIALFIGLLCAGIAIGKFINPEFYAINYLIGTLK